MKYKLITVSLLVIVLILSINAIDEIRFRKTTCETCKMLNISEEFNWGAYGFYSTDGYYCVWTKGMSKDEIATYDEHEECHALIDVDYIHFCNNS